MLGDSGVGKTSFLVHFTTGEFKAGSFSATVGVALTVSGDLFEYFMAVDRALKMFCGRADEVRHLMFD